MACGPDIPLLELLQDYEGGILCAKSAQQQVQCESRPKEAAEAFPGTHQQIVDPCNQAQRSQGQCIYSVLCVCYFLGCSSLLSLRTSLCSPSWSNAERMQQASAPPDGIQKAHVCSAWTLLCHLCHMQSTFRSHAAGGGLQWGAPTYLHHHHILRCNLVALQVPAQADTQHCRSGSVPPLQIWYIPTSKCNLPCAQRRQPWPHCSWPATAGDQETARSRHPHCCEAILTRKQHADCKRRAPLGL